MIKTEIQQIKSSHELFSIIDNLSYLAKNLYNSTLYEFRQSYFEKNATNYYELNKRFSKEKHPDYKVLPSKVAQNVMRKTFESITSYWSLLKKFKLNPSKNPKPGLPRYKHKTKGRAVLEFNGTLISKKQLIPNTVIIGAKTINLVLPTRIPLNKIKFVRIVPWRDCYKIEVGYEVNEKQIEYNGRIAAIDLGVNNLATVVTNANSQPVIISGQQIKSINKFSNKQIAKAKSKLSKGIYSSKKINKLWKKRQNKLNYEIHKITKRLTLYFSENEIRQVIIGKNNGWKQKVNLGKKFNQTFTHIPYEMFIKTLTYKCKEVGIDVKTREESYTSKCSFLDNEAIKKHDKYKGKRVKRGLFKTSSGKKVNADVNAAYNILVKEFKNEIKERSLEKTSPIKLSI